MPGLASEKQTPSGAAVAAGTPDGDTARICTHRLLFI